MDCLRLLITFCGSSLFRDEMGELNSTVKIEQTEWLLEINAKNVVC